MRIRLELYRFQCEKCSRTWEMTDSHMNVEYYCPYCGTLQPTVGLFGQSMPAKNPEDLLPDETMYSTPVMSSSTPIEVAAEKFEYSEELRGPDSDKFISPPPKPPSLMTKSKPEAQREAEDMMTRKVCSDGWWNPVTKKCQGEGNGHALEQEKT
jgi:hypothetical protein